MNGSLLILAIGIAFAAVICSAVWAQNDSPKPVSFLPDDVKWADSPMLPPGGKIAVLSGKPFEAGLYAFRLKFPADFKVMPHSHPEERVYTVIAGTWYIGLGDKFDPAKLKAFPAGSLYVVPGGVAHFHWAKSGESIVQINAVGPTATNYVNQADDPRNKPGALPNAALTGDKSKSSTGGEIKPDESKKEMFIVIYKPGAAWIKGKPVTEQPLQEHGKYLLGLYKSGILRFAGPFTDDTGGAAALEVSDEAEARNLVERDPAVINKIMVYEIRPWRLVPWESYLKK